MRGEVPLAPGSQNCELTSGQEASERFTLGDAPFWPVDRVVAPDAWVGHIPFAFWIVAALRPRVLVELGTHSGNSYLAFAQAVQRLGLGTACFAVDTWRGDAHAGYYGEDVFQELSRYHDARYGAFSRLVRSTFDEAVQHFPDAGVDLLHVDGCHSYEAVAHDFTTWRPKLSEQAVVLFHDTNVREGDFGVWRLWSELRSGYAHFEFLHSHGLGVLGVGSDLPNAMTALLRNTPDAARTGQIRAAFARLGSSQARAQALQHEIEEQRKLIDGLQHEIVRLGKQGVADRQQLVTLEAAMAALHQSRSLRLTRPLREAARWYRTAVARARRTAQ